MIEKLIIGKIYQKSVDELYTFNTKPNFFNYNDIKLRCSIMLVGQRIKSLRLENDITQYELGKELSVSKTTISHYENDTRMPPLETLIQIADYFQVDLDYILGIESTGYSLKRSVKMSDEEIEFILELRRIMTYKKIISNPKKYARVIENKIS